MKLQYQLHDDGQHLVCSWFALCENAATAAAQGPIGDGEFGMVPICDRCATKLGVETEPYSLEFVDFCPYHDGAEFDDGEQMGSTVCTCEKVGP